MQANPFKPFRSWLRPYWREITLGLLLLLMAQSITTILPLLLKQAIDFASESTVEGTNRLTLPLHVAGSPQDTITLFSGIIAALAVISWVVNFGMRWYFTSVSRRVEADIRRAYVEHLVRLPLRFFHERRVGDLMSRAINDVEAIQRFLHQAFRMTLTGLLTFSLSLTVMCLIDWKLALLALAPMPVMVVATNAVAGRVRDGYRLVQEQFANMSARIQENLSGMRVVKANALESRQIDGFGELNAQYVERNRELVVVRSLFYPFTGFLNGLSMVVLLWLGGLRVIDGTLTLGAFVAFNAYVIRMSRPLMMLGRMVDEYQRAIASLARITTILQHPPEDRGGSSDGRIAGEVELRNVSFTYPGDDTPVLDDICLRVPAGDTLAIVGRVGSGKSTLARLLHGSWNPHRDRSWWTAHPWARCQWRRCAAPSVLCRRIPFCFPRPSGRIFSSDWMESHPQPTTKPSSGRQGSRSWPVTWRTFPPTTKPSSANGVSPFRADRSSAPPSREPSSASRAF